MTRYAESTSVSVDNSRAEVERTLTRYGATSFAYGWDQLRALVEFVKDERRVRFILPMPDRSDRRFTHHSKGPRTPEAAMREWEQACRQRWRALALVVKAKLEAVESGISEFEDEFLSHIVLPDNTLVGDRVKPAIKEAYEKNIAPASLLAIGPAR